MNTPLVSICSITYNHAPYIRQCLDGFLMQKTNFKYEIIIHDDASTDGTTEIIKEYAEKYPDLITPIFQSENQYSKGVRGFYARFVYPLAKGKYIALCEGDDYWTDPLKLQKQVDFLEANPEYVMCTHMFKNYNESNKSYTDFYNFYYDLIYDLNHYILRKDWVTQPLTLMFRSSALELNEYMKYSNAKDVTLCYHILGKGKGILLKDVMGVYRIHEGGIWQGVPKVLRIKNEIETVLGIYYIDKDIVSSNLVKNTLLSFGYLGLSFFKKHFILYLKCLCAIYSKLGIKECFFTMNKTANYFLA